GAGADASAVGIGSNANLGDHAGDRPLGERVRRTVLVYLVVAIGVPPHGPAARSGRHGGDARIEGGVPRRRGGAARAEVAEGVEGLARAGLPTAPPEAVEPE